MPRTDRDLRRRVGVRQPKEVILVVVCEDLEAEYLRWVAQRLDRFPLQIRMEPSSDPRKAIQLAAQIRRDEGRKGSPIDQVWCLLSDSHTTVDNETVALAESKKVRLASSNPSFSLWLFLHHFNQETAISRESIDSGLKEAGVLDLDSLTGLFQQAAGRARSLRESVKVQATLKNPSTEVDLLVEAIMISVAGYLGEREIPLL